MKNYSKPVSIIARIAQIVLWIGAAFFVIAFVWSFMDPDLPSLLLADGNPSLEILGLGVESSSMSPAVFRWMMVYGVIAMSLAAMVARNITLISRNLARGPEFSEENSPFSRDNVRMIREIGLFSIFISVWSLVFSWILRLIAGSSAEIWASTNGLFLGLVVLYLSTIIQYGVQLQKDVEGLV